MYELNFNPVLKDDGFTVKQTGKIPASVRIEQEHLLWAENILFIFPTWWGGMPAILKGYIDRVFTNGFAFESQAAGSKGLLKNRKAMIF